MATVWHHPFLLERVGIELRHGLTPACCFSHTVCYKMGYCETLVTLEFWIPYSSTPSFPLSRNARARDYTSYCSPNWVSGVAPWRCWFKRCSAIVHIFHFHLKVAPMPMAAKEHSPHSKSTTTLKTAIRQAAQIPAIPRALHSTPPHPPLATRPSPGKCGS